MRLGAGQSVGNRNPKGEKQCSSFFRHPVHNAWEKIARNPLRDIGLGASALLVTPPAGAHGRERSLCLRLFSFCCLLPRALAPVVVSYRAVSRVRERRECARVSQATRRERERALVLRTSIPPKPPTRGWGRRNSMKQRRKFGEVTRQHFPISQCTTMRGGIYSYCTVCPITIYFMHCVEHMREGSCCTAVTAVHFVGAVPL